MRALLLAMFLACSGAALADDDPKQDPPAPPKQEEEPKRDPKEERRIKKREAEIAKRTAAIERELKPIVERWYGTRTPSKFKCPNHKAMDCEDCAKGFWHEDGQKAFWDFMSPAAHKRYDNDPKEFFRQLMEKQVMKDAVGRNMKLTESHWVEITLEEKAILVKCRVLFYVADNKEIEHVTRWVLIKGKLYLAADGEEGDTVLPPEK